jgi:hypothetical protein
MTERKGKAELIDEKELLVRDQDFIPRGARSVAVGGAGSGDDGGDRGGAGAADGDAAVLQRRLLRPFA